MAENNPRLSAFEARLAQLRKNMEAGLGERAARIESHLRQLGLTPTEARQGLRQEAHKLRGVAGTFGHAALGELAGMLEQIALDGPIDAIARLAQDLMDAVRKAGIVVPSALPNVPAAAADVPVVTDQVRRVLAIDDDPETRKLLDLTLTHLGGFDACVAVTGTEALERLARERFDLVLCDAMMPDMNGLQLCARAKALQAQHALPPVVILSAATPEELGWDLATEHAPFGWWRKPFRPKQLVEDIKALLNDRPR